MAKRIGSTLPTYPYLVAERDGQVIGYAYASRHRAGEAYRWSVDVPVYIAPEAHRRGVGRALFAVLLQRLKTQGFHAAYAGIALPNDSSVGLHEALGFAHIGTYPEVGFKLCTFLACATDKASGASQPVNYVMLRLGNVPDLIDAVTGCIPWLGIFDPAVKWHAFVCPLFCAIVSSDDRVIMTRFRVCGYR
jgi:L-amino acid N-acyltransferase YncA